MGSIERNIDEFRNVSEENLMRTATEDFASVPVVSEIVELSAVNAVKCETPRPQPFSNYFGSKSVDGLYQKIIGYIRPHKRYVEGFAGNGGVFANILGGTLAYLNDVNPDVSERWKSLYASDSNVLVYCMDIIDFLTRFKVLFKGKGTVLYLDPPYPHQTLRSKHRYPYTMTDAQHLALLRHVKGLTCDVLLSTYPNDLYAEELADWWFVDFESVTRGGKTATERLYMNYNPARITELHDYRYFGRNFREREKYKRIAKNLSKKIGRMSVLERNAVLALSGVGSIVKS